MATVSGIGSSLLAPRPTTDTSKMLKDDFLKLLTTQLRHQNPLDPLKDADFAAQLSQFSTLEGVQQLNASFNEMLLLQGLTHGANLIGKTVVYEKAGSALESRGVVSGVQVDAGKVQLVVDGRAIGLGQVRGVEK